MNVETGKEELWRRFEHLSGSFYASPMAMGPYVFITNSHGLVRMVNSRAAVVGQVNAEDTTWSSPSVGNGALWVRGYDALHRFPIPVPGTEVDSSPPD